LLAATALGNFKAAIGGTFRTVREKLVPRYLAEFECRFNRRYKLENMIPRPVENLAPFNRGFRTLKVERPWEDAQFLPRIGDEPSVGHWRWA
jgi:hypothetical protein